MRSHYSTGALEETVGDAKYLFAVKKDIL